MRKLKNIDIVISGNQSSKAMSYSCLTKFFHKTLSHFFKKIIFINLILLTISCKKEKPTEYDTLAFDIQVEDVSCTEVWLKVKLGENLQPRNITLKRENTTIFTGEILNSDTTFIDENLLPKRSYKYTISKLNELGKEISRDVVATTMDTTSHDFTWQIDTLGDGASSVLYDVAIINDTLAYAVGEIYKRDSLGNWDPTFYNLAKWNGRQWTLHRVYYNGGIFTARWILAFSENDIWIEELIHWNGTTFQPRPIDPMFYGVRTTKAWGTSSSDFYVVGNGGFIAHYDGARWRRLESGTTLDVYDIWGAKNHRTGETEIYAVAAKQFVTFDKRILKVTPMGVTVVSDSNIPYSLHGVWFKAGGPYYVVGSGIYRKRDLIRPGPWQWFHSGVTQYYTYSIRGNEINDIFVCGSFGEVLHFNGFTWKSYRDIVGISLGAYYEISVKNNLVVTVGYESPRAIVAIGKRK